MFRMLLMSFVVCLGGGLVGCAQTPADPSLTEQEYLDKGMPALDKPWSASDLLSAKNALVTILREKPLALPRKNSEKSGKVYSKLTSWEPLKKYSNQNAPTDQRYNDALEFTVYYDEIFVLYAAAYQRSEIPASDVADVAVLLSHLLREMVAVGRAHLEYLQPFGEIRDLVLKQLQERRATMAHPVTNLVIILSKFEKNSEPEVNVLANAMVVSMPEVFAFIDPKSHVEIAQMLDTMRNRRPAPTIKPQLDKLVQQIRRLPNE